MILVGFSIVFLLVCVCYDLFSLFEDINGDSIFFRISFAVVHALV